MSSATASRVQFCGADFGKLCGRRSNLGDHRIDSQLCLANRSKGADKVSKVGGCLTLSSDVHGNVYSNLFLRKPESVTLLGFRLLCQENDSGGASCEGDITGYDRNSLEKLWGRLKNAIDELKAVRFDNNMIHRIVKESIALQDKAFRLSNDLNQTPGVVQETIAEVCIARDAVQKATLALYLAEAWLQILMKPLEAAGYHASEVDDEVSEAMIWGERATEFEREANQDVKYAEAAFHRALKSHFVSQIQETNQGQLLDGNTAFQNALSDIVDGVSSETSLGKLWDDLHKAIKELKNVRLRNNMCKEIAQEWNSLQDKASSVSNDPEVRFEYESRASEVEDLLLATMIWGERSVQFEREASQDVRDAENAFQRALKSHFDSQIRKTTQGQLLDGSTTVQNVLSNIVDGVSSETSLEELWDNLHNAVKELKAVRLRNNMIQTLVNESIARQDKTSSSNDLNHTPDVVPGTIDEVCVATLALSLVEASLKILMKPLEAAGYHASEVEDEVLEAMSLGETAVDLEREANQDVKDAEAGFQRSLTSHAQGQVLDTTLVDDDEILSDMAE
ncbi:PREDICTED: K(+) efflux antiporter 2, chloroplastic-like [Camelina sativa]|uniref:K(+) efflux antiporter 2, chloroplastic-like n=1 Tax=Camelina sativa TaxID=90675 RepID=A0ABM0VHI1_CAMSA|nr:PREDICTED: K(+) efflux antiporter 2, chloroplastic-like [Camelina sativa]XP_010456223.1 PREDICTED: K(+) efflux antiporter 2, chloroplastic-like [Camelina sativa]